MACFTAWDIGGCGCSAPPCSQTFTVNGCNALPYQGVTVSAYTSSGGALLASGTTNASGQVTLSWTGTNAPWVTVTGQSARFQAYGQTLTLSCGGSTTLTLAVASGYACFANCLIPLATTITLTDPLGPITLINSTGSWAGTRNYAYPGCSIPFHCGSCPPGTVALSYAMSTTGAVTITYWVDTVHSTGNCPSASPTGIHATVTTVTGPTITCPPSFSASGTYGDGSGNEYDVCLFCTTGATWTATE